MSVMSFLSLQALKGTRSQITAIVAFIFNVLSWIGVITLTPEDMAKVNEGLTILFAYFFADKVSTAAKQ